MDGTGSETSKRQRLDASSYNVSHRLQQQPPIAHSHGFAVNTLPPPNTSYVPQPLPPSPYHESTAHEHRSLPDPAPHGYTQSPSGQNTPIRDSRPYPLDASYSRRGSASASTRSPDGYGQFPTARPLNNAAGNDAQHYPQPYPIENAGHYSGYANNDGPMNGNPHHGLPMSTYAEQSHPNPPGHPSDYGPSSVNAVPHPYGGSTYGGPSNHQNMQRPKKGNRAQQACDVCRTRKAKCDEGRPACGFCVENQMSCNYQTVAPAKADRANQAILDQLSAQNNEIHDLKTQFEARFDKMEQLLAAKFSGAPPASGGATNDGAKVKPDYHPAAESESGDSKQSLDHKITQSSAKRASIVEASPSGSHITVGTHSSGVDSGGTSGPEVPVAIEHTTAAHRLLRWPSIKALVSKSTQLKVTEDYVMRQEEKKGILRVYGRGEGPDRGDGAHPSSPPSSSTSVRSDETPEARSPASSTDGLWGSGFADARFVNDIGGLNRDGTLIIDPLTLRRLLKSYMENIHILHPFLNKASLYQMVETFSAYYNPDKHRHSTRLSSSVSATAATLEGRGESFNSNPREAGKRKRSEGPYHPNFVHEACPSPSLPSSQPPIQKSISTAIVLLVMALGKICEWHDPLPGPVSGSGKESNFPHPMSISPLVRPNTEPPSPISVRSPISSTQSLGNAATASPVGGFPSNRRMTDDAWPGARNVDVIPGLAYYAQATDILGNCHGGNDLAHVQANLLAGLYAGQLARTFESWSWIHTACRACRYLVRDPKLTRENEPRADLIRFAFWTCSQLESDILAELDLPRSGIQDVTNVDYPKGFLEQADFGHMDDDDSTMMFYYSGQIHIRNVLNEIQSNLHPPENAADVENATRRTILRDGFYHTLTRWRNILPAKLQWDDDEEPSTEINDARLRAKYYGALYIVHRPFLRQVLDHEMGPPENQSPQSDSHQGAMPPPTRWAADDKTQTDILQSAQICINAAERSTVAFDKIIDRKRLIVTNIFGTAHAQFGNLIVLATTYKSRTLNHLVPREKLEKLFDRTIRFLRAHSNISSTLEQDAEILERIREIVFKDDDKRGSGSFSSDF